MKIQEKFYARNPQEIATKITEVVEAGAGIIPCGKGSNLQRYMTSANKPLVVVATEKMNSVREFERDNLSITVEAGITLQELQNELEEHALFLPLTVENHGARTMGALIAENEAGYEEYAYGKIQDYLLGLQFVTPCGEIVKTGGKTVKNVSGYDFTRLFTNSLGTLGIITAVTCKLRPRVEKRAVLIVEVSSLQNASQVARKIIEEKLATVTLKSSKDHSSQWRLMVGLAGFQETVNQHLNIIKRILGNGQYSQLEQAEVSDFWSDYYQKLPTGMENIIGQGDKRVLWALAESCQEKNLLSAATFSEIDFGAGRLLIQAPQEAAATIKSSLASNKAGHNFFFNFQRLEPGLIYKKLKTTLDPNNVMFPNNKLAGGEELGT